MLLRATTAAVAAALALAAPAWSATEPPVVSEVSPDHGPSAGGNTVTLTGEHLADASQVLFGGTPGTIESTSDTTVEAVAPAHNPGTVNVRVTTPGGDSATGPANRYTFTVTGPARVATFKLAPKAFRAAKSGPSDIGAAHKGGTLVKIRISRPAKVRFTVERRTKRWRRVKGGFSRRFGVTLSKFRFTGRIGGRKLKPGRYRLVAVAIDDSGHRSKPKRRAFRIKR